MIVLKIKRNRLNVQQKEQWEKELFGRGGEEGLRFCTLDKEEIAKIQLKNKAPQLTTAICRISTKLNCPL